MAAHLAQQALRNMVCRDDAARHQHYDDPEGAYGEDTMRDGDSDGGDYAHADFDAGPMGDAREQPGEAMTETPCWMQGKPYLKAKQLM